MIFGFSLLTYQLIEWICYYTIIITKCFNHISVFILVILSKWKGLTWWVFRYWFELSRCLRFTRRRFCSFIHQRVVDSSKTRRILLICVRCLSLPAFSECFILLLMSFLPDWQKVWKPELTIIYLFIKTHKPVFSRKLYFI
jgi:hypothetical protein